MTAGEAGRLAALERTLVAAAGRQAQRHRQRRRRAVLLLALAAPLVLAAAASVAATHGYLPGIDQQFGSLRDDRLTVSTDETSKRSGALGVALPRAPGDRHAWWVSGSRVMVFSMPDGGLCFVDLMAGCLQTGVVTSRQPLATTVAYGPRFFRVYGLATDEVSAVSVRVRGVTRPVLLAHNTFYFAEDSLGGSGSVAGTLIAHMRDGTLRRVPFGASGGNRPAPETLPSLPGSLPATTTAT